MQKLLDQLIEQEKKHPLSDSDILRLVKGKANVVRVIDLDKYHTLDELLYPYDQAVILYETKLHYGHWCCVTKYCNLVEFFDSYGGMPDEQIEYIDPEFAHASGQDRKLLTKLMYDSPYDLSYNEFQFQKRDPDVSTCGKWCVMRIFLKDLPLEDFKELFFGKHSDDLVTFLEHPVY